MPTRINVLYIEDDLDHVNMVDEMLSSITCIDFEVQHRGDLKSSISYLNSINCDVDIILLDLMLPNSQGVDTFKQVYDTCQVPVVIISAHEDIANECISLGAQDYLIKPDIPPKLLCRSIEYAIERKKLQNKYEELVEVTRAAIYEIDFTTNKFVYVNDQISEMTGYTKKELLGMYATDILTKQSIEDFADRINKLKSGEFIDHTFEYQLKVKDGSLKWTLITAKYKEDSEKNIIGANVVAIDITDKKIAEEKVKVQEEIIFNELENKIHEWREEINIKSIANEVQLNEISLNIQSMSKSEGVL